MEGLTGILIGVTILFIVFVIAYHMQRQRFKRQKARALERLNMNFAATEKRVAKVRASHRANLVNNKDNK